MIQPNELRKGNMILHVDSGIARLITVGYIDAWLDIIFHEEYYTMPRHKILYEKMEPIPLTEAVLRAVGFEFIPPASGYANKKHMAYPNKDKSVDFHPFVNDEFVNITTLHHLQNLVYFLDGKELEINMEELKKAVG